MLQICFWPTWWTSFAGAGAFDALTTFLAFFRYVGFGGSCLCQSAPLLLQGAKQEKWLALCLMRRKTFDLHDSHVHLVCRSFLGPAHPPWQAFAFSLSGGLDTLLQICFWPTWWTSFAGAGAFDALTTFLAFFRYVGFGGSCLCQSAPLLLQGAKQEKWLALCLMRRKTFDLHIYICI